MASPYQSTTAFDASRLPGTLAEMTLRSTQQLFDMQMTTVRTLMETQSRAAAAFGLPDCSDLFRARGSDERVRQALETGTQCLVETAQQTGAALAEIQRQVGKIAESQANTAAEQWQQGLEQLSERTSQSLQQLRETAQSQGEQLERGLRALNENAANALRGADGGSRPQAGGQQAGSLLNAEGQRLEGQAKGQQPGAGQDKSGKRG